MSFIETPRFITSQNYGSAGGPTWSTDVVIYDNGARYVNANWSQQLFRADLKHVVKNITDVINIYEFFLAMQGRANGFRFKNWFDFTSASNGRATPASTDVTIGTGDGAD